MLCIVAQGPTRVIDAPTSNAVLFMALMYGVELRELQTEVNTPSYLIPQGFSNSRYVACLDCYGFRLKTCVFFVSGSAGLKSNSDLQHYDRRRCQTAE